MKKRFLGKYSLLLLFVQQKTEVHSFEIKLREAWEHADKIGKDKACAEEKLNKVAAELEGN